MAQSNILLYGADPTRYTVVKPYSNWKVRLTVAAREAKKALTVEEVAKVIGTPASDPRRVKMTIKVNGFRLYLTDTRETEVVRVGPEPKPWVNTIKDWRSRPKPFLPDGSARG